MEVKELELLAPAGKWETLEVAVENGADAVYLGGKRFNMRLLRPDFNFLDDEIRDAVSFCHEHEVRVYVTVNNLYFEPELDELSDYLAFLAEAGVDAFIVQDLAVVQLVRELAINVPLHASVQMGVANLEAARLLEKHGFSRVILSKNVSLQEVGEIHAGTSLGLEYFVHGDLCISHAGQCYMSSFIFGESSNRGRCRKPCRWRYEIRPAGEKYLGKHYFLAHKDLCLAAYLAELVAAGVTSFKVEGRMREPEYVGFLIRQYRQALDEVLAGNMERNFSVEQELSRRRVRDYTTGSIFGVPGEESIGYSGEREPHFPTRPIRLKPLTPEDYRDMPETGQVNPPRLSVKVGGIYAFRSVLDKGIDALIIGGESFRGQEESWTPDALAEAVELGRENHVAVVMETPRVIAQRDLSRMGELLAKPEMRDLHAVMVNDLGCLQMARELGLPVWAGYGLNTSNSRAVSQLGYMGVSRVTASLELKFAELQSMAERVSLGLEVVVHGPLCGIITDYCPVRSTCGWPDDTPCPAACANTEYSLLDEYGQEYALRTDDRCRTHIYYPHDLCLFTYLPVLAETGVTSVRVEGQHYRPEVLARVVDLYQSALQQLREGRWDVKRDYLELLKIFRGGLTRYPLLRGEKLDQGIMIRGECQ